MSERIPKEEYEFPHIRFEERVVSPEPVLKNYRDTIGVVGEFTKGPFLAKINNREQFKALFGEDNKPGSVAVQQAFLQGATNFIVSRVIPSAKSSSSVINFTSSNLSQAIDSQLLWDAEIGANSDVTVQDRTTGLELQTSFVSEPYFKSNKDIGAIVQTTVDITPFYDNSTEIFKLIGNYTIETTVVEFVDYTRYKVSDNADPPNVTDALETLPLTIPPTQLNVNGENLLQDSIYLVEISDFSTLTNKDSFLQNAKPGLILYKPALSPDPALPVFEVVSYPWIENDTLSIFLKKVDSDLTITSDLILYVTSPQDSGGHYVLGYTHNTVLSDDLPSSVFKKNINKGHSFEVVSRDSVNLKEIKYLQQDSTVSHLYSYYETGVKYKIGQIDNSVSRNLNGNYDTLLAGFYLNDDSSFLIDIVTSSFSIGASQNNTEDNAFSIGTTGLEILKQLESAISLRDELNNIIGETEIQDFSIPYSLKITSSFSGREANRIRYKLKRYVSDSTPAVISKIDDLNYKDDGSSIFNTDINFVGGRNQASSSKRTFYDKSGNPILEVESITQSVEASSLSVSIIPFSIGKFRLEVYEGNNTVASEIFNLDNRQVSISSGIYNEINSSNLIVARFLPVINKLNITDSVLNSLPERLAPPNKYVTSVSDPRSVNFNRENSLKNVKLLNDNNVLTQTELTDESFIEAIDRLQDTDISILTLTGVDAGQNRGRKLIDAALSQAKNSSTFSGLRVVVAAAPSRLTSSKAREIGKFYDDDRLVLVGGWSTFINNNSVGITNVSSVGIYAGILSRSRPFVNPNSIRSVNGIVDVDISSRPDLLNEITKNGIEALYYDRLTNKYKFLNGRTTSKNSDKRWISLRRISDHIITNLRLNLAWARSQNNTPELRAKVASSVNAYFNSLVQSGYILSFIPALVSAANNTPNDVTSGRLNIRVSYTPFIPTDILSVNLTRNLTDSIDI